jgi:hypothetical protein
MVSERGGGKFGGFMYLEDVWMTVLCPVHRDSVWFLQFWVKGPKDNEELEEVSKRVTDRRNQEPGFVEDSFSSKFYDVMGIPSRPQQPNTRPIRDEDEPKPSVFGGVGDGGIDRWRNQEEEEITRFQDHCRGELGFPPNLPVGYQQSRSIPPGIPPKFLRQQRLFGHATPDAPVFLCTPGLIIGQLSMGVENFGCHITELDLSN